MKAAAKAQAKPQTEDNAARPTITLQSVMGSASDTASFGGWGPKVTGVTSILKRWN